MKKTLNLIFILTVSILFFTKCTPDDDDDDMMTDDLQITAINADIDLYDGKTYTIKTNIDNINGSIAIGGNTTLIIENATLSFDLNEDLEHGIYMEDNAKIIIKNSTLKSLNKQWEFELTNNASIDVADSFLKNHSAVKLFNNCTLNGTNSLIEELRMDNMGVATINNCEIYPNMQFFFNVGSPLEFPPSYESVNFVIDNSANNGWTLNMTNSVAQGWQVDVKPNTDITIQNSIDVTLALWSNGMVNDSIHLVNPSGERTDFTITELGSNVNIINTEVFFMNLYLIQNDKLIISGEKDGSEYNTKFLEILLVDDSELIIYDCHVFGQLFHTNNNSTVTLHNCLVGSDDPDDPINSEFAIKDNARGYAFDCDLLNNDIVINGTSILEITNCTYDENRVFTSGSGQLIIN